MKWGAAFLCVVVMGTSCASARAVTVRHKHHHHAHHKAAQAGQKIASKEEESAPSTDEAGPTLPAGWAVVATPAAGAAVPSTVAGAQAHMITQGGNVPASEAVSGIWLPLGERTPIAMFREGSRGVIIARGEYALDTLGSLAAGGFAPVQSHVLPGVTVITLTLPDGAKVSAKPQGAGWEVSTTAETQSDMSLGRWGGGLSFTPPEQDAGLETVQVNDPASGRRLLVGMARSGRVPVEASVRGDGYAVRPSLVGLVVAADDDSLELRSSDGRFVLDRVGVGADKLFAARDLPDTGASLSAVSLGKAEPEQLRSALKDAWFAVSAASPGEKLNTRIRLAQSTARLALGAQTDQVLRTIVQDQPEASARSDVRRLQQVASVLLGRVKDDALLDDGGTAPEDQFWRGMMRTLPEDPRSGVSGVPDRLSREEERARTARMIATGLPSLASYSQPLQSVLVGPAALWVARNGSVDDQKSLTALAPTPEVNLARALEDVRNNAPQADHELEVLAHHPSSQIWPQARFAQIKRGVEQEKLSQSEAARQLENMMPGFRMAGMESMAQNALLEARLNSGQMRDALAEILAGKQRVFSAHDNERLQRLAKGLEGHVPESIEQRAAEVGLLRKALLLHDAVPQETQLTFLRALVERYRALGLPFDEREMLRQLPDESDARAQKQRRMRLIELDLAVGDLDVAEKDLAALSPADTVPSVSALPGAVQNSDAACLRARLLKAQKRVPEALALLQPYTDRNAVALQAELAEQTKDWKRAVTARLAQLDTVSAPGDTANKELENTVLQAAGDASRAQDSETQEHLWTRYRAVMAQSSSAGLFRILTGHVVEE